MNKFNFSTRLAIYFALVAFVSAGCGLGIFAFFYFRNPAEMAKELFQYLPIFAVIALLMILIIKLSLARPQRILDRIDRGEEVPLEDRLAARTQMSNIQQITTAMNALAFGVLPLAILLVRLSTKEIGWEEALLTYLFMSSLGVSSGSQQLALAQNALSKEKTKLGITDLKGIKKDISVSQRIFFASLSSVFLTAMCLIVAAMGIYREYSLWVASQGADAVSSASKAAYGSAEGIVLLQLFLLMLVTVGWSFIATYLSVRNVQTQIGLLESRMDGIASGTLDLTQAIPIGHSDDFGQLTHAFNRVLGKFHDLLRSVKSTSTVVSESSSSLDEYVLQASASLSSCQESGERVRFSVEQQGSAVSSGKATISELSASIQKISLDVATQASQVAQSSASIEEMAANIGSVNKSAEKAGELTKTLSQLSDSGLSVVQDTIKGMTEIQEASASVRDIIGTISKIASQTNLLAMNAAIEAAHAGQAGTGFAVVADEVRALAETSAKSSKEIIGLMKEMEAKIDQGSQRSQHVQEAFSEIAKAVAATSEIVHSIVSAMSEQSQGAQEILASVKSLTDATQSIRDQAQSQERQSATITQGIETIVERAMAIEEAVQDQDGALQSLARVINLVAQQSGTNKDGIEKLDASLGGFAI